MKSTFLLSLLASSLFQITAQAAPGSTLRLGVYESPNADCFIKVLQSSDQEITVSVVANPNSDSCRFVGRTSSLQQHADGKYHGSGIMEARACETSYDLLTAIDPGDQFMIETSNCSDRQGKLYVLNTAFNDSQQLFTGTGESGTDPTFLGFDISSLSGRCQVAHRNALEDAVEKARRAGYTQYEEVDSGYTGDVEDFTDPNVGGPCEEYVTIRGFKNSGSNRN